MPQGQTTRAMVPPPMPAAPSAAAPVPTPTRRARIAPWMVAGAVAALYALWLPLYIAAGHPPDHLYGEDGSFCYRIALHPGTLVGIDVPPYRYMRILYPMVARALALGQPAIIPYTLILVNVGAVVGGTLAVAAWLARRGLSPWCALLYGCFPGLVLATANDLNEPLAYGLAALAIYLYDYGAAREGARIVASAGVFALAALARETTLVFALLYGLALVWRAGSPGQGLRRAAAFLLLACVPFALYKVFLWRWLGTASVPDTVLPQVAPFGGLIARWPWSGYEIVGIEAIALPNLLFGGLALLALRRGRRPVEVWAVLAHVVLFTVLLAPYSFADLLAHARIATGTVLATTLCLPATRGIPRRGLPLAYAAVAWATLIVPWLAVAIFGHGA